MTRQRRWQLKMERGGRCHICGAAAVTKYYCEKHRLAANRRACQAAHKRNSGKRRYAGAEYAGGNYATTVFHFPKWLLAEQFVLEYYPRTRSFSCALLSDEDTPIGFGKSVTQAAKLAARHKKEPETGTKSSAATTGSMRKCRTSSPR